MPVCEHRRSTRHDGARPGVCSEAHLDSNSSSRRGAVGTGVWTARSPILTLQKGKIIPFLPYRRLHGSSWTQGSHRKDVQVVSFSLARLFRTSPRKSGDVKRSVSSSGLGLPRGPRGQRSRAHAGDVGFAPGPGRAPRQGIGTLLQYSCLESPMDRGAMQATINEVRKVWDLA